MFAASPVLYRTSSNKWELGYKFENEIEAIKYLIDQNDEECYDDILGLNKNQRVIVPLKSLFNKYSDRINRSEYKIVNTKDIRHFEMVSMNPVEKINNHQINIGYWRGAYWLVFHTVSRYMTALKNRSTQLEVII